MALRDLLGQEIAYRIFMGALRRGQVAHAYLLVGPQGAGKEFAAVSFAQALNCDTSTDACGECRSCRHIAAGSHPDVQIIRAEGAYLKIEQIRQLQADIIMRPLEGRWKVYIIPEAEKMTAEAANCLLKTLEEPPAYAVLLLLSAQPDALLPTIVSRCQIVRFARVPSAVIADELIRRGISRREEAELIAGLAAGSIGAAAAMAQAEDFQSRREETAALALKLARRGMHELAGIVRAMEKEPEAEREKSLDRLLLFYRDLLAWQLGEKRVSLFNRDQRKHLAEMTGVYTPEELLDALETIEKTKTLIRQNVNLGLALEAMLLPLLKPGETA